MAAASCLLSEDQFLCSICLDVFTDPVTTSCGHNFCKSCITEHWRVNVPCQCPICKEVFKKKPQLKINTFISEMVAQFRHEAKQEPNTTKERQLKIQEIQHSVDLSKKAADRETAEGVEVFTAMIELVSIRPPSYEGTVQYEVDVTLDPNTAHPDLLVSDDRKKVHDGDMKKNLPNNPERFSVNPCVLGKQSFSSGRFYFEVQVKGKTKWTLGVARESINRKVQISVSPEDGYWTIWLRNGNEYKALNDPPVSLYLESLPQKVGVFVDYEEGLVSFYDVDSSGLIYSFTDCCFSDKLLPFFSPCINDGGKNSAPLIITPVRKSFSF
uniref:Uncharacterized protein n=1 Tax=Sphaeramia orbicularis TaxID=375764 RepID=A0A672ZCW1_9TELE